MDYEKKYKEALERARVKYAMRDQPTHQDLVDFFSELKESEDERMIQYFLDLAPFDKAEELYEKYGFSHKDALAWLEKQCEPTEINPSEFDLRLNKLLKQFESMPKEEIAGILSFYLNVVRNDGTYKEEKQGEQKHKIQPKFKVGDLIRHKTLKTEGRIINISEDGAIDVDCGIYEEYCIKVEEWELVEESERRYPSFEESQGECHPFQDIALNG